MALTSGPNSAAIACAFSAVRLAIRISRAPFSRSATTTARDDPPAPSSRIGPWSARQSGLASRRLWTKPLPSLLKPESVPSASTTMVLTAPIRRAVSLTRCSNGIAVCLCGIVTLQPRKPRAANPGSAFLSRSGLTASGT